MYNKSMWYKTQSVVDDGYKLQSGQTKGYEIDICCFSTKHATLKNKSWVTESIQWWANTIKIQLSLLI